MAFTTNGNVAEQFDVLESKLKLDQTVAKLFSIADTISDTMAKHSTKTSIFSDISLFLKMTYLLQVKYRVLIKKLGKSLSELMMMTASHYPLIPIIFAKQLSIILGIAGTTKEGVDNVYTLSNLSRENINITFDTANDKIYNFAIGCSGLLNPDKANINIKILDGTPDWFIDKYMKAMFTYDIPKATAKLEVTLYNLIEDNKPDFSSAYKHKILDIAPNGTIDNPNYTFSDKLRIEDSVMYSWISLQMVKMMNKMIYYPIQYSIRAALVPGATLEEKEAYVLEATRLMNPNND